MARTGPSNRADANQDELVKAAEQYGCTVSLTGMVGGGFPDLVIGQASRWGRRNLLIEVKSHDGVLTPDQIRFHRDHRGQVDIARTVDELIAILKRGPG